MSEQGLFNAVIHIDTNWQNTSKDEFARDFIQPLQECHLIDTIYICGAVGAYKDRYPKAVFVGGMDERSAVIEGGKKASEGVLRIRRTWKLPFPLKKEVIEGTLSDYMKRARGGYLQTDLSDLPFGFMLIEVLGRTALDRIEDGAFTLDWEDARLYDADFPVERRRLTNRERAQYLSEEATGAWSFPKFIALESTRLCNLRCSMCVTHSASIEHAYLNRYPKHFDIEKFKWIIDQMEPYREYISIAPQFQGEPFMFPDIKEMIRYSKGRSFSVGFTSNALLWDEEIIRFMIENNVNQVCVSIDGASKETYEKIRIGGHYETMVSNVEKLIEMRDNLSKSTPPMPLLSVNMTLTQENRHEVEMMLNKWLKAAYAVGINNVCIDGVVPEKFFEPERYICPFLWEGMHILTNGDVIACCRDYRYEEVVGNAYTTSILEIWNGERYRRMRRLHLEGRWNEIPICSKCDTWMSKTGYPILEGDRIVNQYPFHRVFRPRGPRPQTATHAEKPGRAIFGRLKSFLKP